MKTLKPMLGMSCIAVRKAQALRLALSSCADRVALIDVQLCLDPATRREALFIMTLTCCIDMPQ